MTLREAHVSTSRESEHREVVSRPFTAVWKFEVPIVGSRLLAHCWSVSQGSNQHLPCYGILKACNDRADSRESHSDFESQMRHVAVKISGRRVGWPVKLEIGHLEFLPPLPARLLQLCLFSHLGSSCRIFPRILPFVSTALHLSKNLLQSRVILMLVYSRARQNQQTQDARTGDQEPEGEHCTG